MCGPAPTSHMPRRAAPAAIGPARHNEIDRSLAPSLGQVPRTCHLSECSLSAPAVAELKMLDAPPDWTAAPGNNVSDQSKSDGADGVTGAADGTVVDSPSSNDSRQLATSTPPYGSAAGLVRAGVLSLARQLASKTAVAPAG
jgi:hypothetical protein